MILSRFSATWLLLLVLTLVVSHLGAVSGQKNPTTAAAATVVTAKTGATVASTAAIKKITPPAIKGEVTKPETTTSVKAERTTALIIVWCVLILMTGIFAMILIVSGDWSSPPAA